jgi:hypothetical protein
MNISSVAHLSRRIAVGATRHTGTAKRSSAYFSSLFYGGVRSGKRLSAGGRRLLLGSFLVFPQPSWPLNSQSGIPKPWFPRAPDRRHETISHPCNHRSASVNSPFLLALLCVCCYGTCTCTYWEHLNSGGGLAYGRWLCLLWLCKAHLDLSPVQLVPIQLHCPVG